MKSNGGEHINDAFEKFAKNCNINYQGKKYKPDYIRTQIKINLSDLKYKLLFIFDNCDNFTDYEAINDYVQTLLNLSNSKIIITTKNADLHERLTTEYCSTTVIKTNKVTL